MSESSLKAAAPADRQRRFDFARKCDKIIPCAINQPVCNFDYGESGFCEPCPPDCIATGYINKDTIQVCCDICQNASGCARSLCDYDPFHPDCRHINSPELIATKPARQPTAAKLFKNVAEAMSKFYKKTGLQKEVQQSVNHRVKR